SRLFSRFNLLLLVSRWLHVILAVFLASAVYLQSFADLWQCFFLLLSLHIMLSERFRTRPGYWILYGATGALAYFAKAYSFSFFILNTVGCGFFVIQAWKKENRRAFAGMAITSLLTMIILSAPWIYLLHEKYGSWMTSTAGKLNLSWYLTGEPFYDKDIVYFLPPPYGDSPYYWEDPYY